MTTIKRTYQPQPRQRLLHEAPVRQILYGGSAGGGKSKALREDAIMFCLANPELKAYLFRRTLTELKDNHTSIIEAEMPTALGHYSPGDNAYYFVNGSVLRFCYCDRESDIYRYHGAEMHWIGIDEAAHFMPEQIVFLRSRNRLGGYSKHPEFKDKDMLPRFVMASNPGGPAHSFLKSIFIDHDPAGMKVFYDLTTKDMRDPKSTGWSSLFIPARMSDNEYLDADYAGSFTGMAPERAKALRDGDWDAIVGAAFEDLSKARHMVKPFTPPKHWTRFMGMDWGMATPFSIGWYTVAAEDCEIRGNTHLSKSDENPLQAIFIPQGAVIRYREFYGWNGTQNKGCRLDSGAVGRRILEIEKLANDPIIDYRIADTNMWSQMGGASAAYKMNEETEGIITLTPAKKDRKAGYNEVLSRLAGSPLLFQNGKTEQHPMFFITADCPHFWRTVPPLAIDSNDPDKGPETTGEDHCYDEVVYALRSRPYITTEDDRWWEENSEDYIKHMGGGSDPYSSG